MKQKAETQLGPVEGRERQGVFLFAGIPYAAAPTGEYRFAPPQPVQPWKEPLDATQFGPVAPQLPGEGLTDSHDVTWNEDCLTLNVCTPSTDNKKRPVMVWIHGGAYRNGTGSIPWYDGTRFAKESDIVVVTINYRLGALGFARIPDAPTSGINGTLDQIAALTWVKKNIENFGGDPEQVTIAGESAGAFSVSTIMAMSQSRGLYCRAITQSGAGHHVITQKEAEAAGQLLMEHAGAKSLDDLQALTVDEILEAQKYVEENSDEFMPVGQLPFYPSITPDLLTDHPIALFQKGVSADIPLLTGTNTDETTLWGTNQIPAEKLEKWLKNYVNEPNLFIEAVRKDRGEISAGEIAVAISTDHMFRIPAIQMAEARQKHGGKSWMYEFDWKSQAFNGALGACHALEIPFAFGTLDAKGTELFLGTSDLPTHVGDIMHASWVAFIREGNPSTNTLGEWPTYEIAERKVMRFANETSLIGNPWPAARQSWEDQR